jgi:putative ABC transport system permease protein
MLQNYLKVIIRNIFRQKGYSIINLMGLAVGMSSCIMIMLYVQDEFKYDKYVEYPDRVYRIITDFGAGDRGNVSTARSAPPWAPVLATEFPEIENYVRLKSPLVSWMVSYQPNNLKFHEKGFYFADDTVFDFFNINMVRGDPATALKEPSTVVLSQAMARKYFGNEDPIGKVMSLDNSYDFRVTGIMEEIPKNSHFHCEFLASFSTLYTVENGPYGQNYGNDMQQQFFPDLYTYVRLPEGYASSQLEEKLVGFVDRHYGETLVQFNATMVATLQPLTDIHLNSNRDAELQANSDIAYIYIFSAIAIFVLIIACINFMNLATARSAGRAREVGIRKVVGAYRSQLMLQFMGESVIMTVLSLILAIGLTYVALPSFNAISAKELSLAFTDTTLLLSLAGIVVLVGLLAGSYPSLYLSSFQAATVLKGSSKAGSSSSASLRKVLVVFQFSLSIVFIIGTWVVGDQMAYMQNKDLGFKKEQVVIMALGDTDQRLIYSQYKNLILQNPKVVAVTGLLAPPGGLQQNIGFRPEGAPDGETVLLDFFGGDFDFASALEIEIVQGRTFSSDFSTDSTQAFLINEAAATQLGWADDPIGKEFLFGPNGPPVAPKVIGVVKDFHIKSLHSKIEPLVIGFVQQPVYMAIRILPNDLAGTLAFLEEKWPEVYPNDPYQYSFLDADFDNLYKTEQLRGQVFGVFSVLAVFIACLGLLGLASFTAEQRTKEIGIRKVMGASVSGVIGLLTKEFVKLVVIASVIAWPIAYYVMDSWLQDFSYSAGLSPWTFILAAVAAVVITVVTVGYQATKAALTNPADALQSEL